MARTSVEAILNTYGETGLTDPQIQQILDDAALEVDLRWKDAIESARSGKDPDPADVLERVERLLTCHLMHDAEPETQSASREGRSATWTIPKQNLEKWLENTSHGRTLKGFLSQVGITVQQDRRTSPRVFS